MCKCQDIQPITSFKLYIIQGYLYLKIGTHVEKVSLESITTGGENVSSTSITIDSVGQTLLVGVIPDQTSVVALSIEGVLYWEGKSFEIVENNIVWTGSFNLDPTDEVILLYQEQ